MASPSKTQNLLSLKIAVVFQFFLPDLRMSKRPKEAHRGSNIGKSKKFKKLEINTMSVEDFILQHSGHQQDVLTYFHHLFVGELQLTAKIRYKIPFYDGKTWICYLNPTKHQKIELVFLRGQELSNAQGLLNDKGRKMVSGIEFASVAEIPAAAVNEIIHEAIYLDEIGKT